MAQKITIAEAAKIMGKSEQFVRVCIQQGLLPIGIATKTSKTGKNFNYYISPKLFYEYVGKEDVNESTINSDI